MPFSPVPSPILNPILNPILTPTQLVAIERARAHIQGLLGPLGHAQMNRRRFGLNGCPEPGLGLNLLDACDWAELLDRAAQLPAAELGRSLGTSLSQLTERLLTL